MYWIVFSFFMVFEMFGEFCMSWIPLYYEGKIVIIVWLSTFRGGEVIYQKLFAPYLIRWERDIDAHIERVQSDVSEHGARYVRSKSVEVMNKMQAMMVTKTLDDAEKKGGKSALKGKKEADLKAEAKSGGKAEKKKEDKKATLTDEDNEDEWGEPDVLSDDDDEATAQRDSPQLRQRKSAARRHK
jgi:hypothetical protein